MNPTVSKFLRSVALALLAAAVYLAVKYFMGRITSDIWGKGSHRGGRRRRRQFVAVAVDAEAA